MRNEMFTKEALEYLVGVGKDIAYAENKPEIHVIEGQTYVCINGRMERYTKKDDPAPSVIEICTLDGLIEWIKEDVNGFFKDSEVKCIVRVASPTAVEVLTPCGGHENKMHQLAKCTYVAPRIKFDSYMDSEDFGIMIQTNFIDDDNLKTVLQLARNLVEDNSEQIADDGISQRVVIKHGIQAVDSVVFKNPAYLRPLRTFSEIEQPVSPFVIRFDKGKLAAIFEADGGKWKNVAIRSVGDYLKWRLSDENVVVIA